MILLVTTNSARSADWWLRSFGCKRNVDQEKWLAEDRKASKVISPITALGIVEVGTGLAGSIIGNNKLKLASFLVGAKGLALAIGGWVHTYNLISEAKKKKSKQEETSQTQIKPEPQIVERIIERTIEIHIPADTAPVPPEVEPPTQTPPVPAPQIEKEDLKSIALEGLPEKTKIALLLVINEEDSKKQFKYIEDLIKQSNDIALPEEHRKKIKLTLIEIGKKLDTVRLLLALEIGSELIKEWSLLSLLPKEDMQIANEIIGSIKNKDFFIKRKLEEYSKLPEKHRRISDRALIILKF